MTYNLIGTSLFRLWKFSLWFCGKYFLWVCPRFSPFSISFILRFGFFKVPQISLMFCAWGIFLDLTFSLPGVSTWPICLQCQGSSIICTLLVRLTFEDLMELSDFFLFRFTSVWAFFSESISTFMVWTFFFIPFHCLCFSFLFKVLELIYTS